MASTLNIWEVVGGTTTGGLIVRCGKETSSAEVPGRLATGSLVVEIEHDVKTDRLHYERLSGDGPDHGWVSTLCRGKQLLVPSSEEIDLALFEEETSELDIEPTKLAMQLYCSRFGCDIDSDQARLHSSLQSKALTKSDEGMVAIEADAGDLRAELEKDASTEAPNSEAAEEPSFEDEAVGSDLILCRHCHLPVGSVAYESEHGDGLLHGECMAQAVLRSLKQDDSERQVAAAAAKNIRREELDIGWKVQRIPRNISHAGKLPCAVPHGMCCLVFDDNARTVRVAATVEPAAAVNLEYLSTALEVRRRENKEPLFSLDPVMDAACEVFDRRSCMQQKRFEPAWLAGTSVGEVLFQADYYLKELSMGEYEQPIIGMKNCHELSAGEVCGKEWSAREWFVVRKAEVQMSGDGVLLPCIRMGVEAREQIVGPNGLEDVPTTKPTHPLVKYAELFTHNFDLIAERKSAVYHLRELAKASVLAKFLMEVGADLDESWFTLGAETSEACCMEVPQLWSELCHSRIRLQDGKIVNMDDDTIMQRLYGGVQFGLDKFQLSGARQPARMLSAGLAARQFVQPARHLSATLSAGLATRQFQRSFGPMGVQPARVAAGIGLDKFALTGARQPARMMSAGLAARQFVQPARHLSATLSAGLATRQFQRSFGPMGVQPARVSAGIGLDKFALTGARQPARMMSAGLAARQFVQPARHLSATLSAGLATRQFQRSFGPMGVQPARVSAGLARGVDLNLDEFDLSAPTNVSADGFIKLEAGADISSEFWSSIGDALDSPFDEESKSLLRLVFHPALSDRETEGDRFVPPDTSSSYVQRLHGLVEEERDVQRRRRDHFCSKAFRMESPGPLFPSAWVSAVEILHIEAKGKHSPALHPRPDWKAQAHAFEQALESAVPVFERSTEDGTCFRIYRIGSIEVRTTQEQRGMETIGAVFSSQSSTSQMRPQEAVKDHERLMKVTEYVERCGKEHRCFIVFETELGNSIVIEDSATGTTCKRIDDPENLADRTSLAKVTRTSDCKMARLSAGEITACGTDVYKWATGESRDGRFRVN